jgi:phenylpyruvate tautomerase PptA (4-oxalocrotonate tautomerase family)
MPHLQFEINKKVSDEEKKALAMRVMELFSLVMDTGTDHIGISIREYDTFNLFMGRVKDNKAGVALVNADIRAGRTMNQRRKLALGFMDILNGLFFIPHENIYVTFTEHKGEDFNLHERFLSDWSEGEDPLA